MSVRSNSLSASATLAIAVATITWAGSAFAADMPVKEKKPPPPPEAPFFFVNQNSLSYSYAFTANNPGAGKTPKDVLSFTHFDVWAYGTNFFNVDWLKATNGAAPPNGAPAAPCDRLGTSDCSGFTEIYGLFRSTFGWNQIFNTKAFAVGPLTNIEFVIGSDLNTDNTTLGSAKRSIQGGLQFDFATPYKGFVNVSVSAYKEWQNDGFAALGFGGTQNLSGKVDFDATWAIEALYSQPLAFQPLPLTFKSFAVIHGPKGCGEPCGPGPGLKRTTEYLTQQTLLLDVGKLAWGKPDQFAVWTAYRWWKNKFGIDPNQPGFSFPFTVESTWLTGATWTF
jgi:hypothetical protein